VYRAAIHVAHYEVGDLGAQAKLLSMGLLERQPNQRNSECE
jgi:hypothetical protein